jgi:hypothetical protein
MKDPQGVPWSASPTAKARHAAQKSVTALLDELAPERVLKRIQELPGQVEQHRTPDGCVLQTATAALSVSWFGDTASTATIGELHVIVWQGKVARRGATRNAKGATLVSELVLRPNTPPTDDCVWIASDGAQYDTPSLAAKCLALLEAQVQSRADQKTSAGT